MKNSLSPEQRELLIDAAQQVRKWAYIPYSHYAVGAALLTTSGRIYDGANVENASFPLSNCAERTAIFKAVSEGEKEFLAIAVVTDNGGTPCGGMPASHGRVWNGHYRYHCRQGWQDQVGSTCG